ncbi:hypothetical protein EYY60_07500 [Flavobacterium zhairuonense]|uniref:hypothetical protein n=1 Tax=Flavobacterium zhairuonense TaxID=2493631 RepID=UPI001052E61E|nr:hypothetical protein [Flavobacterium zhairuonense]KAF2512086.1 hypothetical protein EYY60_07500 [Flavobacterium zhairuonense]
MKELIIESKGIRTNQYFIPPFELREGELVVLYLEVGCHFDDMKEQLIAVFTGKVQHENVKIIKPLTFAEPFKESISKKIFNPITVEHYLKKHANVNAPIVSKIFEIDTFTKKTKVKDLGISEQKRLSLTAVFSKTKNVVFDLRGEGASCFFKTYEFAKDEIKTEGAAILIDWSNELKNDCSKFIAIEWLVGIDEQIKIGNRSVSLSKMY